MKEKKKLEQQKVLNAEKALSDEELGTVSGGFGQKVTTENGVQRFTCHCGAVLTVTNDETCCPYCGALWSMHSSGGMIPNPN